MQKTELSLVQNKELIFILRQGIQAQIVLEWLEADASPSVIDGIFAQIRTDYVSNGGTAVHTFSLVPDADGNYFEIDAPTATTVFYLSEELTRSFRAHGSYYFEVKQLDAGGNAVASVVMQLKIVPEVAKP